MTLFERIKNTANDQGISLLSLNEKAGLGSNAIYKWKTQQPGYNSLKAVADVLGVSVDYLLGNTDEKHLDKGTKESQDFFKIDLSDVPESERQQVIEQMEEIKKILTRDMR